MRQVAFALLLLSASLLQVDRAVAAPEVPPAGPNAGAAVKVEAGDFDAFIERVRRLHATGEWQDPNWNGRAELDRTLTKLIDDVKRAANRPDLQVGPPLDAVRPGGNLHPRAAGGFFVVEDADVPHAQGSVFLASGNVRISHATGCIIIAGGAAEVSHGRGNLIVAGHYLHVSHDGHPFPRDAGKQGSVLMSGDVLDVSHATDSTCSSPGQVEIDHATGVTFINSPQVKTSRENDCRRVEAQGLVFTPSRHANPLKGKLTITQAVPGNDARQGAMAIVKQGEVEVVVRKGAEVTDAAGKPLEGLAGWKLSYVAGNYVLFARGTDGAGFIVPGRP